MVGDTWRVSGKEARSCACQRKYFLYDNEAGELSQARKRAHDNKLQQSSQYNFCDGL